MKIIFGRHSNLFFHIGAFFSLLFFSHVFFFVILLSFFLLFMEAFFSKVGGPFFLIIWELPILFRACPRSTYKTFAVAHARAWVYICDGWMKGVKVFKGASFFMECIIFLSFHREIHNKAHL